MSDDRGDDGWCTRLRELHAEAGGCMQVVILPPPELARLALYAAAADARALAYFGLIREFGRRCAALPPRSRPLCLRPACRTVFTPRRAPAVIAVLHPHRDDATRAAVFGLCGRCADRGRLDETIIEALRAIWPELRPLSAAALAPAGNA